MKNSATRVMVGMLVLAAACRGAEAQRGESTEPVAASSVPAHRVDTVVPREVALARFRADLVPVAELTGGRPTRDELVRALWSAVIRRDSVALATMALGSAEFAWLYYPTHPQSLAPYDLPPGLMWFTLEGRGRRGATELLRRIPEHARLIGYRCAEPGRVQGANRVWAPCVTEWDSGDGRRVSDRIFGPIVERGGVFKFVNYENRLD